MADIILIIQNQFGAIITNCGAEILQRADAIYRMNKCVINDVTDASITFDVSSQSNRKEKYVVVFKLDKNNNLKVSCNCPYDYGGNCKHIVACALLIRNEQPKVKTNIKKLTVQMSIYTLTFDEFIKKIPLQRVPVFRSFLDNSIKCSTSQRLYGKEISFNFFNNNNEKNKLYVRRPNTNTIEIETDIDDFFNNEPYTKALFNHLTTENFSWNKLLTVEYQKEKILKQFGFKNEEEAKAYLQFNLMNNEVTYWLKSNNLIGLNNSYLMSGIKKPNEAPILKHNLYEQNANADLSLGFMLDFQNSSTPKIYVEPLLGEKEKTNLLSKKITYLKECKISELPSFTNEEQKIITIAESLRSVKGIQNTKALTDFDKDFAQLILLYKKLKDFAAILNKKKYPIYVGDSDYKPTKKNLELVEISTIPCVLKLIISTENNCYKIELFASFDNEISYTQDFQITFTFLAFQTRISENSITKYYLLKTPESTMVYSAFANSKTLLVNKNLKNEFYSNFIKSISNYIEIEDNTSDIENQTPAIISSYKLYVREADTHILLKPIVYYDATECNVLSNEIIVIKNDIDTNIILRNYEDEQLFIDLIEQDNDVLKEQKNFDSYYIAIEQIIGSDWLTDLVNRLKENNVEVLAHKDLKKINLNTYKPKTKLFFKKGKDWFDLEMNIDFNGKKIALKDIKKALIKKENYINLGNGAIGLITEEWKKKYAFLLNNHTKDDNIELHASQFNALDDILDDIDNEELLNEIELKKQKLLHFSHIKHVQLPKTINATFRDYQLAGYNWLHFLHEFNFGGCLADDMGLGKTLQTLAFLKSIEQNKKPHLIIVPTTLLFNWEDEIKKFTTKTDYLIWHGTERIDDINLFKQYHIILTTYGVCANDIDKLKTFNFNYVVLDEAQAIKNPTSLRYKAVCKLKSSNKLTLTGTPIENSILDLYAQLSFLNPGLLGNTDSFKNEFLKKIEVNANADSTSHLKKLITPFVLRRTKEQVLKDLPAKTESILYCEMESEQRKIYNTFRDKIREDLLNKIKEEGMQKAGIHIIDGMLKLRQICNSPAILKTEEDYGNESIKIKELIRILKEKTGDHKVLVFSQFVKMLKLVETELKKEKIEYTYLDGSTTNRNKVVSEFIHNDEKRVFLLSLKAGGVGLNLTIADYVFLIDPWWNPAVEKQAIDRTHRIGQDKKVFSYKMICKDSIEEKIIQLQADKMKLSDDIISNDTSVLKGLQKEDVMYLFS